MIVWVATDKAVVGRTATFEPVKVTVPRTVPVVESLKVTVPLVGLPAVVAVTVAVSVTVWPSVTLDALLGDAASAVVVVAGLTVKPSDPLPPT